MSFRRGRFWRWSKYPKRSVAQGRSLVRTNKRIARLEKGIGGKEKKYHDGSVSTAAVTPGTGGLFSLINAIAQGNTSETREGLWINVLSLQLKAYFEVSSSQTANKCIRLMIIRDELNQGAAPAITDVLESANMNAFPKHENRARFRILYDKKINLTLQSNGVGTTVQRNYYKKFKRPIKCHYIGTAASAANTGQNALYLFYCINSTGAYDPGINIRWRMRFTG